ncbi:hypothetical protein E4U52_006496 [Claviceps spartinae]|nr:hypothetical protein E4U52_006496 [Claviceps spartinae]
MDAHEAPPVERVRKAFWTTLSIDLSGFSTVMVLSVSRCDSTTVFLTRVASAFSMLRQTFHTPFSAEGDTKRAISSKSASRCVGTRCPCLGRPRLDRFYVDAAEPREGEMVALDEATRPRVFIGRAPSAASALWASFAIEKGGD